MSKTLSELQDGVRFYARDGALDLTTGDGLNTANRVYRQYANLLSWPELRRQDTSITTTSGTENYNWLDPISVIYVNIQSVEIQDGDDSDNYCIIGQPPDEWSWSDAGKKKKQSVPDYYLRFHNGTTNQIALRPAPKYSSKNLRITGIIEPDEFKDGASKTVFTQKTADDALEYLIAASIVDRDGDAQWAQNLIQKSVTLLERLFDKDQIPKGVLSQVMASSPRNSG